MEIIKQKDEARRLLQIEHPKKEAGARRGTSSSVSSLSENNSPTIVPASVAKDKVTEKNKEESEERDWNSELP